MANATDTRTPARGSTTRESLIQAGIAIFGRDGFDAASTRAISESAGVNQALIGYHFGGKPGLYLAAIQFIADRVAGRMGPLIDAIDAELGTDEPIAGDEAVASRALELLQGLIDAFVRMLTGDESSLWARLILREQQDPSDGFDILYDGIMHRMLATTARLVRCARGEEMTPEQAKLTAITILGQALVFRAARTAVMREMGWSRLSPAELEVIQAVLRRNVAAMLGTEWVQ